MIKVYMPLSNLSTTYRNARTQPAGCYRIFVQGTRALDKRVEARRFLKFLTSVYVKASYIYTLFQLRGTISIHTHHIRSHNSSTNARKRCNINTTQLSESINESCTTTTAINKKQQLNSSIRVITYYAKCYSFIKYTRSMLFIT